MSGLKLICFNKDGSKKLLLNDGVNFTLNSGLWGTSFTLECLVKNNEYYLKGIANILGSSTRFEVYSNNILLDTIILDPDSSSLNYRVVGASNRLSEHIDIYVGKEGAH